MKIQYVNGDMFAVAQAGKIKFLAHGVNCLGIMGSGVAKTVKEKFPKAFEEYKKLCDIVPEHKLLGNTQIVVLDNCAIFNCFTQLNYGSERKRYVNYEAVKSCIQKMNDWATGTVIMPKIGAGLGRGDWDTIADIIEMYSTSFSPLVAVPL